MITDGGRDRSCSSSEWTSAAKPSRMTPAISASQSQHSGQYSDDVISHHLTSSSVMSAKITAYLDCGNDQWSSSSTYHVKLTIEQSRHTHTSVYYTSSETRIN